MTRPPRSIPGVILAGGLATRLGGGDKTLLPLGEGTILGHVIARLRPQVGRIALNANGDPARFAAYPLPVIADSVAGFPGPLGGILAAMDWAAGQGAQSVVTVAGDTPFFPPDLVERLREAGQDMAPPLVIAGHGGRVAPDLRPVAGRVARRPARGARGWARAG